MGPQGKNVMIGLFVTCAVGLIIFILLFLRPSIGDQGQIIFVRFSDIDKVSVGTRVTFAGKPIGEVVGIKELEDADVRKGSKDGKIYTFILKLAIDSAVKVYTTDSISIRTSGLLGEKSISITPLPLSADIPLKRINSGMIVDANESGSLEDTMKEFKELSDKFEETLNVTIENLRDIQNQKLWEKIARTTDEIGNVFAAIDNPGDIKNMLTNLSQISTKVNDIFSDIQKRGR
jgi:phospholipid/cholesterol/gamma-HCH transport system substrate-binding protein